MISEVTLRVAVREGKSYLASGYYTPPFKVVDITEDKRGGWLQLMLMCSSPGILDGDEQALCVKVGEGGRLRLHTQSYQRLFQMEKGAVQRMEVRLGAGAYFCWLPHPCVPHARSIFKGMNRVYLSEGSRLIWGEVLTCGRKLNGEVFAWSSYHVRTEVFIGDELVLLENIYLKPSDGMIGGMGQWEGYTHMASLLVIQEGGLGGLRERVEAGLAAASVVYGVSEGPAGSLVIRMLGNSAELLYNCLKEVAGYAS
ncbi:MAG: urease accessory protein UreD [Bacteroidetes bacterium]|nr:urease accessory protein UreD [Bacteroidota bacterium]